MPEELLKSKTNPSKLQNGKKDLVELLTTFKLTCLINAQVDSQEENRNNFIFLVFSSFFFLCENK